MEPESGIINDNKQTISFADEIREKNEKFVSKPKVTNEYNFNFRIKRFLTIITDAILLIALPFWISEYFYERPQGFESTKFQAVVFFIIIYFVFRVLLSLFFRTSLSKSLFNFSIFNAQGEEPSLIKLIFREIIITTAIVSIWIMQYLLLNFGELVMKTVKCNDLACLVPWLLYLIFVKFLVFVIPIIFVLPVFFSKKVQTLVDILLITEVRKNALSSVSYVKKIILLLITFLFIFVTAYGISIIQKTNASQLEQFNEKFESDFDLKHFLQSAVDDAQGYYNVNGTYKDYVIPEEIITKKKGLKLQKPTSCGEIKEVISSNGKEMIFIAPKCENGLYYCVDVANRRFFDVDQQFVDENPASCKFVDPDRTRELMPWGGYLPTKEQEDSLNKLIKDAENYRDENGSFSGYKPPMENITKCDILDIMNVKVSANADRVVMSVMCNKKGKSLYAGSEPMQNEEGKANNFFAKVIDSAKRYQEENSTFAGYEVPEEIKISVCPNEYSYFSEDGERLVFVFGCDYTRFSDRGRHEYCIDSSTWKVVEVGSDFYKYNPTVCPENE